jgi:hypothetical protein
MNKKTFFLAALLLLIAGAGFSLDFGGVLSQAAELNPYGAGVEASDFSYSAAISPWVSAALPNNVFLYLSAGFTGRYEAERWKPLFEVGRFELAWQARPNIFLQAGRFAYHDPLSLVADGLFDGLAGSFGLGNGRLSLDFLYTGLLYKKTANVTMSAGDSLDYADEAAYWAPSRFLVSALYTLPGLFSWRDTFQAGVIIQTDGRDDEAAKLHTQYLIVQYHLSPLDVLFFDLGGSFGLSESGTENPRVSYALSLTGNWSPPTAMNDRISLRFRYGSGREGDSQEAFTPITGVSQSSVLTAKLSGLMALSMIYSSRLLDQLSLVKETTFLMRTDAASFFAEGLDLSSESPLLGLEAFLRLVWAPFSDLSLNAGGGIFLPLPNGAFHDTTPAWKISAGLAVSF